MSIKYTILDSERGEGVSGFYLQFSENYKTPNKTWYNND